MFKEIPLEYAWSVLLCIVIAFGGGFTTARILYKRC